MQNISYELSHCLHQTGTLHRTKYSRMDRPNKIFEDCLAQNLLGPFLKLVSTIFYQFFFFFNQMIGKNCKKCFIYLKRSFRFRDIHIFLIFPLPLHLFQIQKNKWKWNNLCHELACINLKEQFLK